MKRILIIATVYRCGEKIYPIIPRLTDEYDVDVFVFNQMSKHTPWYGNKDPRKGFYKFCSRSKSSVIQGPNSKFVRKNYCSKKLYKKLDLNKYDLVILDDNKAKTGWGTPFLCREARKKGCIVVGTPHGNHEYDKYNLENSLGDVFDYSFVFGEKEANQLSFKSEKKKLIPGGIPSNDRLKNMKIRQRHILVVTSYVEKFNSKKKNKNGYLPFNEEAFLRSGILEIQKKYDLKVIIKEKSRFKKNLDFSLKGLEKYPGVSVIMDHPDNDILVSNAFCLISAPSTMCFKAIQLGIPTVLLKNFGMTGNFYDFDGLVDLNKESVISALERQRDKGKDVEFIKETLEGGVSFSSTEVYLNEIDRILSER